MAIAFALKRPLIPSLVAIAVAAGTPGIGLAQDGTLVHSRLVRLADTSVRELIDGRADMGSILSQVEIRAITYLSDGLRVTGYLVAPVTGGKLPGVIFNRGGNREFGALTDPLAAYFLARIASWGYVVVASNYRGNGGGEGKEEFGGSDVNDVLNLLPLLGRTARVDTSRIGMVGWSRGGLMTCLALTRTDQIKAAVIGAGAFDAIGSLKEWPEFEAAVYAQLIPNYQHNRTAALEARSPVLWADKLNKSTPLLLLHGADDTNVHPREAMAMASELLKYKRPFRLVMFERAGHFIREHEVEVDRLTREWLDRFVRDGEQRSP